MKASKLSVLFATIVVVAICEQTTNIQNKPGSALIDTRFRRQIKVDTTNLQEKKIKDPLGALKKPSIIRPSIIVPIANSLNPLRLSKQHIVPFILKRTIAPTKSTEVKINEHFDIPSQDDDCKIHNDSEIIKTTEKTETCVETKTEKTENKPAHVAVEIVTKEHVINGTDKVKDENSEQVIAQETDGSISETELSKSLITELKSNHKSPAMPIPKSLPFEITVLNKQNPEVNESRKGTKVCADVSLAVNFIPTLHGTADNTETKMDYFESPFSINQKVNLTEKNKDSTDLSSQNIFDAKDCKMQVKNESDVSLKLPETEADDKIVIQNNNYEKLFESSATPQHLNTKLIASDLRFAQNQNYINPKPNPVNQYRSGYKQFDVPKLYDEYNNYNNPYLHNNRKYPFQYVANTYDGIKNRNNFNDTLFSTKANQWNQNYNSYYQNQAGFGQRGNFNNHNQGQINPNRIGRAWKNNQIVMRPKASKAGNIEDLYSRRYFANARNIPVYSNAVLSPYASSG